MTWYIYHLPTQDKKTFHVYNLPIVRVAAYIENWHTYTSLIGLHNYCTMRLTMISKSSITFRISHDLFFYPASANVQQFESSQKIRFKYKLKFWSDDDLWVQILQKENQRENLKKPANPSFRPLLTNSYLEFFSLGSRELKKLNLDELSFLKR